MLLFLNAGMIYGQLGGQDSYEFLNLPVGARVAGLGGVAISSTQSDVNLFLSNPSLLDSATDNHISWSYFGFYADVKYNTFAYARNFKKLGMFGIGVQNLGYGEFERYDAVGNPDGTFKAGETAVVISKSHRLGPFQMGASIKYINARIDTYGSSAVGFDIGGTYHHPAHELAVSILFKNLGVILTESTPTARSSMPTDVQVGMTYKPKHMPFRLTMTAYNLLTSNSTFYDESLDNGNDEPSAVDDVFRHINFGLEIVINQNFNLRTGYNHLIRKELSLDENNGLTGFTLGAMIKIKSFELSYTLATYHVDGGRSYFTITSDLNRVFKKKSVR